MSGLAAYGSSDEDEVTETPTASAKVEEKGNIETASNSGMKASQKALELRKETSEKNVSMPDAPPIAKEATSTQLGNSQDRPVEGPTVPALSPEDESSSAPQSPSAAYLSAAQNLTLPTVLNLDIPPSPPGSPPPGLEAKLEKFLQLKAQGVHFNEKLASSSALKNPSLLGKLMSSAGLSDEQQYATNLSKDLWDPAGFPVWAYKEGLARDQQKAQKAREDEVTKTSRNHIDFIAAGHSGASSRSATPGLGGTKDRRSAAERILDGPGKERGGSRGRSKSPRR